MKKHEIIISAAFILLLVFPAIKADIIWDDTNTVVNTLGGNPCTDTGEYWSLDAITYYTIPHGEQRIYDCRGDPFAPDYPNACCPIGFECGETGPGVFPLPGYSIDSRNFTCLAGSDKNLCSDFVNEEECKNSATSAHAKASIESMPGKGEGYCGISSYRNSANEECTKKVTCKCVWNSTAQNCTADEKVNVTCDGVYQPGESMECQWLTSDDDGCNLGKSMLHVIWTLVSGDSIECGDYFDRYIGCGNAVKLNFFTIINLIAAIMIIAAIYYLYYSKRKKGKETAAKTKRKKKK